MLADRCETEEALEQLDASLGMVSSPEEQALAALREHQEALGMTFENPQAPVPPDDKTLYGEGDVEWQ